jgi:type I restriction-modification system DNA methylase subunit
MVKSPTKNGAPAAVVERIHERLSKGEGPSSEVIRQESVRAELPISMLEAILRLDKRFVKAQAGWQVQAPGDRWTDLARALLHSTAEGSEAHDLFWQVVVEMNAATRLQFTEYYPNVFTFPDSLRKQVTELIRSCPSEKISELKGPIFDLVMSYLFDDAEQNRFFTPRAITWLAAAWACPQPGERIVDPCYGSGGFLLAMAQACFGLLANPESRSRRHGANPYELAVVRYGSGSSFFLVRPDKPGIAWF